MARERCNVCRHPRGVQCKLSRGIYSHCSKSIKTNVLGNTFSLGKEEVQAPTLGTILSPIQCYPSGNTGDFIPVPTVSIKEINCQISYVILWDHAEIPRDVHWHSIAWCSMVIDSTVFLVCHLAIDTDSWTVLPLSTPSQSNPQLPSNYCRGDRYNSWWTFSLGNSSLFPRPLRLNIPSFANMHGVHSCL